VTPETTATSEAVPSMAGTERTSRPQPGRFALVQPLRSRDFRLMFSGETISMLGDQFHFVALAWLALQLTGSGLALGPVLMVAGIPRAVEA
jgi:hypothetical protein